MLRLCVPVFIKQATGYRTFIMSNLQVSELSHISRNDPGLHLTTSVRILGVNISSREWRLQRWFDEMFLCPCQNQDSSKVTVLSTAAFSFAHSAQRMVTMQEQSPKSSQKLFFRLAEENLKPSWDGLCKVEIAWRLFLIA